MLRWRRRGCRCGGWPAPPEPDTRAALEARWLTLTRDILPGLAAGRGWPVRADHCFQRILLDNAVGGCWYESIAGRPAYRHAAQEVLVRAVRLAEAVIGGGKDLGALNLQSLRWRGKAGAAGDADPSS